MQQTSRALIGITVLMSFVLGACSAGGAPSPSPTPIPPDASVTSPPDGGGIDPGLPQPQFVSPKPGQLATHPVSVAALTSIDTPLPINLPTVAQVRRTSAAASSPVCRFQPGSKRNTRRPSDCSRARAT
jgi:hypothetical protein